MRGCDRPIPQPDDDNDEYEKHVWRIDFCVRCDGKDQFCPVCCGRSITPVKRCPRAMCKEHVELQLLVSYFYDYIGSLKNGGPPLYPTGQYRWYQPVKLVQAFRLLSRQEQLNEEQERERENKKQESQYGR